MLDGVKEFFSKLGDASTFELSRQSKSSLDGLLEKSKVGEFQHVYTVGSFDQKRTIPFQQRRGACIAFAIANKFGFAPKNVAIIGGGFSGITATATLLRLNNSVTLFEKENSFLPLQRQCTDRYLHPYLYEWPVEEPGSSFELSGISWSADIAAEVCIQAETSFREITNEMSELFTPSVLTPIKNIKPFTIGDNDESYRLIDAQNFAYGAFDAVIFCVGYGQEKYTTFGSKSGGYWRNSAPYNNVDLKPGADCNFFISGTGDGALIDALSTKIENFSYLTVFEDFKPFFMEETNKLLVEMENEFLTMSDNSQLANDMISKYDELLLEFVTAQSENLPIFDPQSPEKSFVSQRFKVTLNAKEDGVFTRHSSALNRYLAYILIRTNKIKLEIGGFDKDMVVDRETSTHAYHTINWKDDRTPSNFEYVGTRHGIGKNSFVAQFGHLIEGDTNADTLKILSKINAVEQVGEDVFEILNNL